MAMNSTAPPGKLYNETATSAPRSGRIGVLPVDELESPGQLVPLFIAVACPSCTNYSRVSGTGDEYRNITKLIEPEFDCSVCSWRPTDVHDSPTDWSLYYQGRLGGTLVWAVNEPHMEALVKFLETPPKRRKRVEYDWEYKSLMARLPQQTQSGRFRNDMVSLVKKLQRTIPHDVRRM